MGEKEEEEFATKSLPLERLCDTKPSPYHIFDILRYFI